MRAIAKVLPRLTWLKQLMAVTHLQFWSHIFETQLPCLGCFLRNVTSGTCCEFRSTSFTRRKPLGLYACVGVCVCVAVLWSSFPLAFRQTRTTGGEKLYKGTKKKKWKPLADTEVHSGRSLFVQLLAVATTGARAAMLISASLVSGTRDVSSRSGLAMREAWCDYFGIRYY